MSLLLWGTKEAGVGWKQRGVATLWTNAVWTLLRCSWAPCLCQVSQAKMDMMVMIASALWHC